MILQNLLLSNLVKINKKYFTQLILLSSTSFSLVEMSWKSCRINKRIVSVWVSVFYYLFRKTLTAYTHPLRGKKRGAGQIVNVLHFIGNVALLTGQRWRGNRASLVNAWQNSNTSVIEREKERVCVREGWATRQQWQSLHKTEHLCVCLQGKQFAPELP